MKNLLFITLFLVVIPLAAQRTAADHLSKALPLLKDDPCNTTGIAWVKGALQVEPDNTEAIALRRKCTSIKVTEAKKILSTTPTNPSARVALENAIKEDVYFDTEENNLLIATALMERPNHVAERYVDKLIGFSPSNIEYRWMRVRCNANLDFLDDMLVAVSDLNFIIENSTITYKATKLLVDIHYELSNKYRLTRDFEQQKKNLEQAQKWAEIAVGLADDPTAASYILKTVKEDLEKLSLQD